MGDSDDEAEKDRKETNKLLAPLKPSKQEAHLSRIVQALNQANIYQQQLILEAGETTKAVQDGNNIIPPSTVQRQVGFDISPVGAY